MRWSWSLSLEEHFYILSPFLISGLFFLKTHRQRLVALTLLFLMGPLVRLGIYYFTIDRAPRIFVFKEMYAPTHARFDSLIAGIILAYFHRFYSNELRQLFEKRIVRSIAVGVPVLIAVLMTLPSLNPSPLGLRSVNDPNAHILAFRQGILYFGTLTSIFYGCLTLHFLYAESALKRVLSWRPFIYMTTLSYPIYLLHWPIAYKIAGLLKPQFQTYMTGPHFAEAVAASATLITLLTVVLSGLLAYIIHLLVEKPILAWRERQFP